MSIRKTQDDRFLLEMYIGARRTRRTFPTFKEAKDEEQWLCHNAQTTPIHGLEEALLRYLNGEAKALRSYASQISVTWNLRPFLIGKCIPESGEVADTLKRTLKARGLTNSTINRRLALLRRLCNLAFDWGWVEVPYGKRVKLLEENPERHFYLTVDEVEHIANLCPLSGNLIRLAAYTGLRQSELFGLGRENIKGRTIVLGPRTKNGRPRAVPVPDIAEPILNLIPFHCTYHVLRGEFERARAALGLAHIRFHDLRHSYASFLVGAGASDAILRELLGHQSTQMTRRYAHLRQEHLEQAIKKAF